MSLGATAYVTAFGGSLALVWGLTPLVLRYAVRKDILDHPGAYKQQVSPVPYLGGVGIVVGFVVAVVTANLIVRPDGGFAQLAAILGAGLALSVVGLLDDLRNLGLGVRIVLEVAAAVAMIAAGVHVSIFGNLWADGAITVLWIFGISNAFNLLDNMDGLSAGLAAIAAGWFFVLAALKGQFLVAALAAALAGCALGFLRHNFHPATIYMGDAGSLFLGFMLAVLGIKLRFDGPTQVTFLVPILVCGIAIFDTALVSVGRLAHGRNPFSGGRDHVSHRLVFMGIPVHAAVALIYTAGLGTGWVALVVSRIDRVSAYILTGLVGAVALVVGVMLAWVPVYGPSRRRVVMLVEVAEHEPEPAAAADAVGAGGDTAGAR